MKNINNETQPKVLVVDDDERNIYAIKKILQPLDIELHEALSGKDALTLAIRNNYAVIFLDVNMPEMSGYEVADALSGNSNTSSIPIVFVTAVYNDNAHILSGYESGAIDYLTKPICPEVLIAKTKIFIKLYNQQQKLLLAIDDLDKLANNDSLTGLSNRHQFNFYFQKLVDSSKRYNHKFALLLLDIDNFKIINDTFGHDIGDELLRKVSGRIQSILRISDHVSRLGGDEFAILLPELNSPSVTHRVANNLLRIMTEKFEIDNNIFNITLSIGIAIYPLAYDTVSGIFKAADIALYRAKDMGKNSFQYYTESLNKSFIRRSRIERDIPKAIEENRINLLYQPRVHIKTKAIVGIESLARWQHPELGDISPVEFISIAEESNLIHQLGDYLITKAFTQFEQWQNKYPKLSLGLAVNLSPHQLLNKNFINQLNIQVSKHNIDLNYIEFELTEALFKGDLKELEYTLAEVCKMGFKFSIDDFGTGYSSLSRLKTLPISTLKIDQSFVRDILEDKNDVAIIKAIIALANALHLEVVAEGVELKEQEKILIEMNCLHAQGFYYSKPVNAKVIDDMLKNNGHVVT